MTKSGSHDPLESLRNAWGGDFGGGALPMVATEELERRARRLSRQILVRNTLEWAAGALVIVLFASGAFYGDRWLTRVACAWTMLAALWTSAVLLRRGGNLPEPPPDAPTSTHLRYHRAQLERQATLLERVPFWYVLPLASGTALFLADRGWELVERQPPPWAMLLFGASVALCIAVYVMVLLLNRHAARKLRQQLAWLPDDGGALDGRGGVEQGD